MQHGTRLNKLCLFLKQQRITLTLFRDVYTELKEKRDLQIVGSTRMNVDAHYVLSLEGQMYTIINVASVLFIQTLGYGITQRIDN